MCKGHKTGRGGHSLILTPAVMTQILYPSHFDNDISDND